MKSTLARLCAIVLLAIAGPIAASPAHASPAPDSAGWVTANLSYDPAGQVLTYTGHAWGWGSTKFDIEGWLYNGGVMVEHVDQATCTGFCYMRVGQKQCPPAGAYKFDVWAFPHDGTPAAHDVARATVI